ncbi:MAG TPA: hypothetical protein VKA15_02910, partial [Isosphaeraceae bacterium]|nr:hypothetical protein [Isosphaeraceae bacterium]
LMNELLSHHFPTGGDASGCELPVTGVAPSSYSQSFMDRKPMEVRELDASGRVLPDPVGSAPRRTRTYNPLIKSQQVQAENAGEICQNPLIQDQQV